MKHNQIKACMKHLYCPFSKSNLITKNTKNTKQLVFVTCFFMVSLSTRHVDHMHTQCLFHFYHISAVAGLSIILYSLST